jgi:hypothetical protein
MSLSCLSTKHLLRLYRFRLSRYKEIIEQERSYKTQSAIYQELEAKRRIVLGQLFNLSYQLELKGIKL